MPERKQPIRTCVACRTPGGKKEFLRLVRTPEGTVEIDQTGKKPGRGAYICPTKECLSLALKKKSIARGLRTDVPAEIIEQIRALTEKDSDAGN